MAGTAGSVSLPGPRIERATAVTDGSGVATFAWPAAAFTTPPVVTVALEANLAFRSARIVGNTPTATTVAVQVATGVELLGIQVLGVGTAAGGVEVHAIAMDPT